MKYDTWGTATRDRPRPRRVEGGSCQRPGRVRAASRAAAAETRCSAHHAVVRCGVAADHGDGHTLLTPATRRLHPVRVPLVSWSSKPVPQSTSCLTGSPVPIPRLRAGFDPPSRATHVGPHLPRPPVARPLCEVPWADRRPVGPSSVQPRDVMPCRGPTPGWWGGPRTRGPGQPQGRGSTGGRRRSRRHARRPGRSRADDRASCAWSAGCTRNGPKGPAVVASAPVGPPLDRAVSRQEQDRRTAMFASVGDHHLEHSAPHGDPR